MIQLNDGTQVPVAIVLRYMALSGVTSIATSQQHVGLFDHTNLNSLDCILRFHAENMDTAQATESVTDQLLASGYFHPTMMRSPVSGRMVRGLKIV